jgi:hypothetical protein
MGGTAWRFALSRVPRRREKFKDRLKADAVLNMRAAEAFRSRFSTMVTNLAAERI